MIVASIQPCFIPWLGYFEQMARADLFVYLDDDRYSRKNWRNTNRLKSPDGPRVVSVPVQKASQRGPLNEALIAYHELWQERLLNQLSQWYGRAPRFDAIYPAVEAALAAGHERLVDLDYDLNGRISEALGIETPIRYASEVPRTTSDKNGRIFEICQHFGADLLYDGRSARDFIDQERFRDHGIDVVFQDYQHPTYDQLWGEFLSHMSALDLLMNHEPGSAREILLSSPIPRELGP